MLNFNKNLFLYTSLIVSIGIIKIFPTFGQSKNEVNILDQSTNPGLYVDQFSLPPASIIGSIYYNDDFELGTIYFRNNNILENVQIRHDLENNMIEIKIEFEEIKWCDVSDINKLVIESYYFESGEIKSELIYKNFEDQLYLIVYENDSIQLIEYHFLEIKKPNYNVALDNGSREPRIIKKSQLFILKEGEKFKIKNNHEHMSSILDVEESQLKSYMKKNGYKYSNKTDLSLVVKYFSTL